MSKRDIQTVCELAAHLMVAGLPPGVTAPHHSAPRVASDAMRLQRLGRRARNNETKRCNIKDYYRETDSGVPMPLCRYEVERTRIHVKASEILYPYGLKESVGGDPRGCCLHILGLPGNTLGGDESGYGI